MIELKMEQCQQIKEIWMEDANAVYDDHYIPEFDSSRVIAVMGRDLKAFN